MAPSLIDWTKYRDSFATRLSAATGRPVSINGDVDFVILPRPALNANAVRVAGDIADDFVAVDRLSARLAFLPLLRGDFVFRELVLAKPEARVTRNDVGKIDFLDFDLFSAPGQPGTASAPGAAPFDINVERIVINDGVVTFQDTANGSTVSASGIDLALVARPANLSLTGDITLGNVPVNVDATLGRSGGTRALTISTKLPEADAAARFSGTVTPLAESWDVRGDLNISGASSAGLLAAFGVINANTPTPQAAQKPFTLTTRLRGTAQTVTADPLILDIGGTAGKGTIVWTADTSPKLDVKIETSAVDVQTWKFADATPSNSFNFVTTAKAQTPTANHALYAPFKNLAATFELRMPVLSYRDQTLRGGLVTASLAQGELTVTEASIEMPGATRAKAYGLARFEDDPTFEGALEVQSGDLRGALTWLGLDPAPGKILQGRLTNASFRAALQGTLAQLTLSDVTATVDTSAITGRMSWHSGSKPLWGLDLTLNSLNVDAYLPLFAKVNAPSSAAPAGQATYGVKPTMSALDGLAGFDADVNLQIDALTLGGVANGKAGIDFSLRDSALNLRSASFENVGGATAWFSGSIGGLGVTPHFDDVQFDLSAADLERVGRAFGFSVPELLRPLTPVSLTGVLKGSFAQADMAATFKAGGLTMQADGQALNIDQQPHVAMNVDVSQASFAAFMKAAGQSWPIGMADPGAVKVTARVTHDQTQTKIESLALRIGDNVVGGELTIARGTGAPEVTGALTGVALALDKIMPPAPPPLTPVVATPRGAKVQAKPPAHAWSEEAFDWRFLKGWRGNLQIAGPSFSARGIQVQQFSGRLLVGDAVGEITEWNGKVFNAPGQLYLRMAAEPVPVVQGEVAFIGGDLAGVAAAINGGTTTLKSQGKADFAGSFRAQGASPASMIASLSGSGSLKVSATETGTGVISGLLGAVVAASQAEGQKSPITLETRFSAADGRIKVEDATVASKSYGGAFTGTIDLPRWLVDMSGRLRLESAQVTKPAAVPITIKGALDLPNIMLLPAK